MKERLAILGSIVLLTILLATAGYAQVAVQAIDVAGDSISKGFNAGSSFPCANADQENYNWLTSDTHGSALCTAGNENVFSILERLECDYGTNIFAPFPNHAASGATLLHDLYTQSQNVRTYLMNQPAQRMAVVFLGHNDNCSGTATKINSSCSNSDLDPANYCKTRPASFERELRKGLDVLMSIGDTRVGVVAPVRLTQLCNFQNKQNCQFGGSCQFLWGIASICAPLTRDCSPVRIIDSYTTVKGYRDILKAVATEYSRIPPGGMSRIVMIGGETVGGGVKAPGTDFVYSDAPWYYKFKTNELSCCDCFHPSALGQNTLASILKSGLNCTRTNLCCRDTGDALADGQCAIQYIPHFYGGLLPQDSDIRTPDLVSKR